MKTALWVRGLSFRYPDYPDLPASPLFAGLNLDLPAGEIAVLLGQPDTGKSTLCRILAGLVPRFTGGELEGRISLGDRSLDGVPPFELVRDVGLVFQNPAEQLFTSRCESEIAFALESLGVPRRLITRQVGAALRQLGIAHLRQRNPDGLSGGEKKKLALACLQAVDPAVWILDETLEELDAGTKRELLARMRAVRRTVLITSAKWYDLFGEYCTRFLLLEHGQAQVLPGQPGGRLFRARLRAGGFILPPRRAGAGRRTRGRPLLEAENLLYRYPGEKGFELKVEHLEIPRGGTLAVVGDNGSGKSTLARLLCGLLTPDRGEVRVAAGGAPAAADPAALSRFTAYVFQDPDLQIFLPTVAEELGYGLRLQGLPAQAVAAHVADTATLFGLTRLQSPPALLSYGARKRLQSAVYYLLDKPLLIFDEGDSGLSAAEFLRLVGLFQGPGRGILVITHDLGLAGLLADRVVRLEKGKLA